MLVDVVLERNREFVRGRTPSALPPVEQKPLAVVACYDPRLDQLLLQALGIEHGEAFLLRTAGALVLPGGGVMRSLGLAVFMFGAREILVVGHTSCRMATFSNTDFVNMFRARGVPRDAFGSDDLREWAGAIPSPQRGVLASVENIARVPFLPRDVSVSGAVLDDTSGALELVVRGGQVVASAVTPEETEPAATPAVEEAAPVAAETPAHDRHDADPLVAALADVLGKIERQDKWRTELQILRRDLARTGSVMAQYRLLESFLRRAAGESREAGRSLLHLRETLHAPGTRVFPQSLARLLTRMSGGRS